MTTPTTTSQSEVLRQAIGTQAASISIRDNPVVRWPQPRSASPPELRAANAPATPMIPSNPIVVCESSNGGAASGSTIEFQNTLTLAKIKSAKVARSRRIGSSTNSATVERNSAEY